MSAEQKAEWEIYGPLEQYYQKVSEKITQLLLQAITQNGYAIVGLSGGNTPGPVYAQLAQANSSRTIPWEKVFFIWADERVVPWESPESNYKLVRDTLLKTITIPEQNIYPIPIIMENPQKIQAAYEGQLEELFTKVGRTKPFNDMVILGMGTDGHTASLFPGIEELTRLEEYHWVITPYIQELKSYRVSLTPKILNTATTILVLVTGEKKAHLIKKILTGQREKPYPIELVQPEQGKKIWLLDTVAAQELT